MNTNRRISSKESQSTASGSLLMRAAGLSAVVAGLGFVIIGEFHPLNEPASVTTAVWVNVHLVAFALPFFGLFGMAGLYARQAKQSGWLGLTGFILFSLWIALQSGFSFVEALILPRLAAESPRFVEAFLGMFGGAVSKIDLGILPTLWTISSPMYLIGPLLFGLGTFRAGVLPRWAGALMVVGAVLAPVSALFIPPQYQPRVMIPNGLALIWLGAALLMERREQSTVSQPERNTVQPEPSQVA